MPGMLNVHALPTLVEPEELLGSTAVVIDVLRSTTTIVHALAAGAREVFPCGEVEDARKLARQFPRDQVVLGGERHGLAIQGFDLGNSPEDYTPERLYDKTLVITTTNGTRAMARAGSATQILLAAFVNATAVYQRLQGHSAIHILCSGTEGQFGDDDLLLAGMLVDRLQRGDGQGYMLNAQAITVREMWLHKFALPLALGAETLEAERLAEALYETAGGRNLAALGFDEDILAASQIDRFTVVPEMDPLTMRIYNG
jgi:2-phosphosulfolactate phosphatase